MGQEKELSQFTKHEYGELLLLLRQHVDKTQQEIADDLGAPLSTYRKWEQSLRKPRPYYRRKIRDTFEEALYALGTLKRERDPESGQTASPPTTTDQDIPPSTTPFVEESPPSLTPSEQDTIEVSVDGPEVQPANGLPATDRDSNLMQQSTSAGTHQELWYHSLSTEDVMLLLSLERGDDFMSFEPSKRDTLRRIAVTVLAAARSAGMGSFAISDPEPWERLSRAQQASSPSTMLNEATLVYFEQLLSISWQLCDQNQFTTAEGVLGSFLPQLRSLPRHEPNTALLTSQGLRLQSILAHHHLRLSDKVHMCEQSVTYAREAGDANALISALIELARAYEYAKQPDNLKNRLITLQEAIDQSGQASPLVQASIYSEYSLVLAESGRIREAEFYIGLAEEVFPDDPTKDPGFAFTNSNMGQVSWCAGLVCVHTGSIKQAFPAFERYKQHPSGLMIPERILLGIANGQSRAAILDNDADRYALLLEDVLVGSVRIESKKRFDEALTIFREEMPESWLLVQRIKELAEQYGLKRGE